MDTDYHELKVKKCAPKTSKKTLQPLKTSSMMTGYKLEANKLVKPRTEARNPFSSSR